MLITSWEPSRLAQEMTTVVDAAAASLWLSPETADATTMLAHGFARVFDLGKASALSTARTALRCDEHACTGYARWEINDRWDGGASPNENIARYTQSARFYARLGKQKLPPPFAASAAFLRYLAMRDVFVRETARNIFRLRRLLNRPAPPGSSAVAGTKSALAPKDSVTYYVTLLQAGAAAFAAEIRRGRAAARAMWRRTRDPRTPSPNELGLAHDLDRLQAWRKDWLRAMLRCPELVYMKTPFCGHWQLSFTVHNVSPALQQVVVEQQLPDGIWHKLGARFAIEFRAAAARPRANVRREFSVPVDNPLDSLRIAVRGLGRIGIENVTLTDGVVTLRPRGRRRFSLGRPAPRQGWPEFTLRKNADERVLKYAAPG